DRMVSVQPRRRSDGNEELAAIGSRTGVGHGEFARLIEAYRRNNFILELIPGAAGARAQRIAALNHEIRDHPVEDEAVVKLGLLHLSRFGILVFLGPVR